MNFPGHFDQLGRLRLRNREQWDAYGRSMAGKEVTLTVEKRKTPKTLDQLGFYYSVVLPDFGEACGEDDMRRLHIDLKDAFLAKHSHASHVTGEVISYTPSLADVSIAEMSEYLDKILRYAAGNGWTIREPR
jgi:hypothetical protein